MEDEKNTQAPTIKDAVTYIVDKDGNEVKQPISQKPETGKQKAEGKK